VARAAKPSGLARPRHRRNKQTGQFIRYINRTTSAALNSGRVPAGGVPVREPGAGLTSEVPGAAHGRHADLSDQEVLERRFALNPERAAASRVEGGAAGVPGLRSVAEPVLGPAEGRTRG